ncbi:GNAT family protein [Vreelandella rituensis]|uniref:N-acetyltransferase n=1 Tax=Vreelandella rituensis TaxID=2282306 RepID=A0A368TS79_9GAMM|nr:GNAT family protein [Halomonas rituensis]RCV86063.1 N-acetyltransferase [Halomonas rituensis]
MDILKGKRIQVRPLECEDLPFRVNFINDTRVSSTLGFDLPLSIGRTKVWYGKVIEDRTRKDFTIVDSCRGNVVGFCGLLNIKTDVRSAEVYIIIGDVSYWGKGFGRDAKKILTNYSFSELFLNKLYAYQADFNERSLKANKKLGWKLEGVLRDDILLGGKLHDRHVHSILQSEWDNDPIYQNV